MVVLIFLIQKNCEDSTQIIHLIKATRVMRISIFHKIIIYLGDFLYYPGVKQLKYKFHRKIKLIQNKNLVIQNKQNIEQLLVMFFQAQYNHITQNYLVSYLYIQKNGKIACAIFSPVMKTTQGITAHFESYRQQYLTWDSVFCHETC